MKLVEKLAFLKLDHVANIQSTKIVVRKLISYNDIKGSGCKNCIFQKEGGAADCSLRDACMAHKRPDRISVIFKSINSIKNKRS